MEPSDKITWKLMLRAIWAMSLNGPKPGKEAVVWKTDVECFEENLERAYSYTTGKAVLDKDFLEKAYKRLDALSQIGLRIFGFLVALKGALALGYFGPELTLNIFGLSIKGVSGLREILAGSAAVISIVASRASELERYLQQLVRFLHNKHYPKHLVELAAFLAPFPTGLYPLFPFSYRRFAVGWNYLVTFIQAMVAILAMMIIGVCLLAFDLYIAYDIFMRPSNVRIFSWLVLTLIVLSSIYSVIVTIRRHVKLPYIEVLDVNSSAKLKGLYAGSSESVETSNRGLNSENRTTDTSANPTGPR